VVDVVVLDVVVLDVVVVLADAPSSPSSEEHPVTGTRSARPTPTVVTHREPGPITAIMAQASRRPAVVASEPVRIVSLLPSTTEILFAIGAGEDVVGVTFECDYPAEARTRRIVSTSTLPEGLSPGEIDLAVKERMAAGEDLYRLDEGALRELDVDVVVTQDLCAVCAVDVSEVGDALEHLGCEADVVTLDPMRLDEVLASIALLGTVTGHEDAAGDLASHLRSRLDAVRQAVAGRRPPRVAVLEWTDPLFCAGHWVPDLVEAAGGDSVLGAAGQRSHQVEAADVARAEPEIVVVAPCGYRLNGAVELARSLDGTGVVPPGVALWAVDADAEFVRPGPRLVDGVETLAGIFHPDAVPARPGAVLVNGPGRA
jgi:iron complex transport system substrate-binding protein